MRVYLPATLPLLRVWLAAGVLGPAPLTGFAVTPGLREWYVEGDSEELEYAATGRAARAALRLLAAEPQEPRRVVLAVDVPEAVVRDDLEEGAVRVPALVPWSMVASGMVDDVTAEADVAAAVAAVDAADLGDAEAEFAVGTAEDHELLWFATQELGEL